MAHTVKFRDASKMAVALAVTVVLAMHASQKWRAIAEWAPPSVALTTIGSLAMSWLGYVRRQNRLDRCRS